MFGRPPLHNDSSDSVYSFSEDSLCSCSDAHRRASELPDANSCRGTRSLFVSKAVTKASRDKKCGTETKKQMSSPAKKRVQLEKRVFRDQDNARKAKEQCATISESIVIPQEEIIYDISKPPHCSSKKSMQKNRESGSIISGRSNDGIIQKEATTSDLTDIERSSESSYEILLCPAAGSKVLFFDSRTKNNKVKSKRRNQNIQSELKDKVIREVLGNSDSPEKYVYGPNVHLLDNNDNMEKSMKTGYAQNKSVERSRNNKWKGSKGSTQKTSETIEKEKYATQVEVFMPQISVEKDSLIPTTTESPVIRKVLLITDKPTALSKPFQYSSKEVKAKQRTKVKQDAKIRQDAKEKQETKIRRNATVNQEMKIKRGVTVKHEKSVQEIYDEDEELRYENLDHPRVSRALEIVQYLDRPKNRRKWRVNPQATLVLATKSVETSPERSPGENNFLQQNDIGNNSVKSLTSEHNSASKERFTSEELHKAGKGNWMKNRNVDNRKSKGKELAERTLKTDRKVCAVSPTVTNPREHNSLSVGPQDHNALFHSTVNTAAIDSKELKGKTTDAELTEPDDEICKRISHKFVPEVKLNKLPPNFLSLSRLQQIRLMQSKSYKQMYFEEKAYRNTGDKYSTIDGIPDSKQKRKRFLSSSAGSVDNQNHHLQGNEGSKARRGGHKSGSNVTDDIWLDRCRYLQNVQQSTGQADRSRPMSRSSPLPTQFAVSMRRRLGSSIHHLPPLSYTRITSFQKPTSEPLAVNSWRRF